MPVIFDEVTAEVAAPPPPPASPPAGAAEPATGPDALELVRLLAQLSERAARLSAD
jgi:hypothetical protein